MCIDFTDPAKQELWNTVRAMNDAWTKGNPDDLSQFFHPNMVVISATQRNRLEGGAACVAAWKGFANTARVHSWKEIDPAIHIYGNSAVVTYYFDLFFEMDGQKINMCGRDMFFFVKESGKWLAVADQYSAYPH